MEPHVTQTFSPGMFSYWILMLVWLAAMVATLVAFFRGMRALGRIAATLERIEQRMGSRPGSGGYGDVG